MTDYNRMKIKDLRQIGKDMGLLRVDKNNKKDLIERLKKGKQLSDYNKNVLLDHARKMGILANAQMSKETILKKLTNPRGSSYIELPEYLKNKKAITNIKNDDDKCFLWCVLRALNPVKKNKERIDGTLKGKIDTLNMKDIKYPITLPTRYKEV